jgi:hypothetical protein
MRFEAIMTIICIKTIKALKKKVKKKHAETHIRTNSNGI